MVKHTLVHSCAKTLARKFKLNSRSAVFAKFGPSLAPKDELSQMETKTLKRKGKSKNVGLVLPTSGAKTRIFKTTVETRNPLETLN
jgi:hypothetical protein